MRQRRCCKGVVCRTIRAERYHVQNERPGVFAVALARVGEDDRLAHTSRLTGSGRADLELEVVHGCCGYERVRVVHGGHAPFISGVFRWYDHLDSDTERYLPGYGRRFERDHGASIVAAGRVGTGRVGARHEEVAVPASVPRLSNVRSSRTEVVGKDAVLVHVGLRVATRVLARLASGVPALIGTVACRGVVCAQQSDGCWRAFFLATLTVWTWARLRDDQVQCDVAIGNTYYMGKMLERDDQREWAASVGIFFPNQNDRGTHMNVSGGAVTRDAVNKYEAVRLLEFLSGDLAQYMYDQVNHEYPVKEGVPYSGIVSSFGSSQEGVKKGVFKQDKRNLSKIGSYRKKSIQILDEVNYDK